MRIVFLDVDGPLIPGRMYFRPNATYSARSKFYRYCPSIVDMVNWLTDATGSQVVFNSMHNTTGAEHMIAQAKFNGLRNVRADSPVTGFPQPMGPADRIGAMMTYVAEHDVSRFVYFDDEDLRSPIGGFQRVDFEDGITVNHIRWAVGWFTNEASLGFTTGMSSSLVGKERVQKRVGGKYGKRTA